MFPPFKLDRISRCIGTACLHRDWVFWESVWQHCLQIMWPKLWKKRYLFGEWFQSVNGFMKLQRNYRQVFVFGVILQETVLRVWCDKSTTLEFLQLLISQVAWDGNFLLCSLFEHQQLWEWATMPWRTWFRHCHTIRKVAGSIPNVVIGIFHWLNPSGRTMALSSTQPLRKMSTRGFSCGTKVAGA